MLGRHVHVIDLITSLQLGNTAIVLAARYSRTEVVKVLVQKNADINSQTEVHFLHIHVHVYTFPSLLHVGIF